MKPLLRAVLIIDALMLLAFGLLFLLTPWTSLYNALQLAQTQPTLVGLVFGIALIGLAWLAVHASIDGALTVPVARTVGHVNWLTGLLMLVWVIGFHRPEMSGFGELVAALVAVALVLLGFGGVRLAGSVRRRERLRLAEAALAEREAKRAARETGEVRQAERVAPVFRDTPVAGPGPSAMTPVAPFVPGAPAAHPVEPVRPAVGFPPGPDLAVAQPPGVLSPRDEARNAAADSPGAPRPPFHG